MNKKRAQKLCVYNRTRESFLSLGVTLADNPVTRLKGLLGKVRLRSDEGLWTVPSQGIHTICLLFPIDVIYLDANNRVVHLIENLATFRIAPIRTDSASVLQLRTYTIYSSNTHVGDQLVICSPQEMERYCRGEQAGQAAGPADAVMLTGILRRMDEFLRDRRRARRFTNPGVVAYYWDGGAPASHRVRDLSRTGAYVCTEERWYPGTIVQLSFSPADAGLGTRGEADTLTVWSRVVRHGPDGVALEFIFTGSKRERDALHRIVSRAQARRLSECHV